jgi:hypothetical protein
MLMVAATLEVRERRCPHTLGWHGLSRTVQETHLRRGCRGYCRGQVLICPLAKRSEQRSGQALCAATRRVSFVSDGVAEIARCKRAALLIFSMPTVALADQFSSSFRSILRGIRFEVSASAP